MSKPHNHCIDDVKLPMEQVQFPARCISSEEHMLVTGLLVQLGSKEVKRAVVVNRLKLDVVPSVAIRVLIFRDQVTEPWNQVHARPVKYLLDQVPILRLCNKPECECGMWHNANKLPTQDALLDVWKRGYLNDQFKPCKPNEAAMYSVMIRIPQEIHHAAQAFTGRAGVFAESRSEDGMKPSPEYQVVMPKDHR